MEHPDLEFAWQEIRETNPKVQADVITEYVKNGVYTPNEGRDILGLDEIEGGDQAIIMLASGPILLKDVEKLSDNAANPPEPPPMPAGGPRPGGAAGSGGSGSGAAGKPASDDATFPAPGTPARGARAQRREDAGRRAALAAEATGLLRRSELRTWRRRSPDIWMFEIPMRGRNLRFLHDDVQMQVRSANTLLSVLRDDFTPLLNTLQGSDRDRLEKAMRRLATTASDLARNAANAGQALGEFVRDAGAG
jgi:hypothetical protein